MSDLQQLRKEILNSNLLRLAEEIERLIILAAPAIPDGLSTLYKSRQTFSSTVAPDASPRELFEVKIRNRWIDENCLESNIAKMEATGEFRLSASDLENACTRERKLHKNRLMKLEKERNSGFCRYISDDRLQKYLSNLSANDLSVLSQFIDSHENPYIPFPYQWWGLRRRIVMGLHGRAIINLARRIDSVCQRYLRSTPDDISIAEENYGILIPAVAVGVTIPVWKCAHWLAAKASPQSPFIFEVDTTARDRIVGMVHEIRNSVKLSALSSQSQSAILSSRMAVAITL